MAELRNPLANMQGDEEMTRYVGVLERRLVLLTIQEVRFRALLEALTGQAWDDSLTNLDENQVIEIAEATLVKSLGISKVEAAKMVRINRETANLSMTNP